MKVALISSADFDPNTGVSGSRIALSDALRKLDIRVDTYFMDDLKLFSGGLLDRVIFPWRVASKIKKWREYDLIDIASGDGWILTFMKNRPITVFSSHGLEHLAHEEIVKESMQGHLKLSWKYPLYWGGIRLQEVTSSIRRSDMSIVLNKTDKDYIVNQMGIELDRIRIVPNGIPDYFLNQNVKIERKNYGLINIAQVGSYIQRKGIDYSTKALNKILSLYPNVSVTFFGTGCPVEQVHKAFNYTVIDRVHVIENYNHVDLPNLLRRFHINLFPSLSEGFGKTLIEAMSCGLAPITFETPGPNDIVNDNHDALVVPRRNIRALENAIEQLINDETLLYNIRHNAYQTAQKYSWYQAAEIRLNAYKQALKNRDKRK
ncbi:glycosyltransferase family 4 protein [Amphibacillus cookii]|uniref:glycosyltransferase family 4 protein n=1 Tax=Amphibacillus cookii TaxID=767787 RepID=UPI00195C304A|nr:glycosyltransferase family 4 protein [Amphibacillus cookii]MBM7540672.1 glycosyltransferase involved in cell wall biosynthesis [Amphibacillus cookii]